MNYNEIIELIKTGEGFTLEFKEKFSETLSKDICAFANASGGRIILGVKDGNNEIIGFKLTNLIKSRIQDIARNIDPSILLEIEQVKKLVIISVPEGKNKPYFLNGRCFLRQGANSQHLSRNEIRNLFQKENLISFERKINYDFTFEQYFNERAFVKFIKWANLDESLEREHILINLGLLTELGLNNAGVLFFSTSIHRFFLNAIIGCVLYQGTERVNILDKAEYDLDFISNLENSITFLLRNLRTEFVINDLRREEKPEVPKEVLRELLLNAMVHRDYFSEGRILIEIFQDRIEISNPGGLLFEKKYLGKKSLARNPLLMDLVHRMGLVEKIGSGINRIKKVLGRNIRFELEDDDWFRAVIIRAHRDDNLLGQPPIHLWLEKYPSVNKPELLELLIEKVGSKLVEKVGSKLSENQLKILLLVAENSKISKKELARITGISVTAVDKNIKKLKNLGAIHREGSPKSGEWKITEANSKISDYLKNKNISRKTLLELLEEKVGSKLVVKVGSKLTNNQIKILIAISCNPTITIKELSNLVGISVTAIGNNIRILKDLLILRRLGSDKKGYWEIIN